MIPKNLKKVISTYFFDAQKLASKYSDKEVTMQFFQRENDVILCGIREVIELLKPKLLHRKIKLKYLEEGELINSGEIALELQGRYEDIAIFEGVIDGILSRSSSLATNARKCVEASQGTEVICMADRSDHYRNIESDCWAYYIGGIRSFSAPTLKNFKFYKELPKSVKEKINVYHSLPHGAIQIFQGDTLKTMENYQLLFPKLPMIALVDFNNNVVEESISLFKKFGKKLKAVRVDTNPEMKDLSLSNFPNSNEYKGVNTTLIKKLREELNKIEGKSVKIYLSSGFSPEKISNFISENIKVDGFGVGQYLTRVNVFFTGDLVKLSNLKIAKQGRGYKENPNLKTFTL